MSFFPLVPPSLLVAPRTTSLTLPGYSSTGGTNSSSIIAVGLAFGGAGGAGGATALGAAAMAAGVSRSSSYLTSISKSSSSIC